MKKMTTAWKEKDSVALSRLAHSLKSASANVGATSLSNLYKKLELASKDKDIDEIDGIMSEIHSSYQAAIEALKAEMNKENSND